MWPSWDLLSKISPGENDIFIIHIIVSENMRSFIVVCLEQKCKNIYKNQSRKALNINLNMLVLF